MEPTICYNQLERPHKLHNLCTTAWRSTPGLGIGAPETSSNGYVPSCPWIEFPYSSSSQGATTQTRILRALDVLDTPRALLWSLEVPP
jgi:hypothetical protein